MVSKTRTVIEVTVHHLKLMQTIGEGDKAALSHCALLNIQGLPDDAIAKRLTALDKAEKLRLNKSEVVVIISRPNVILRYLNLPSQNPQELRQMVHLQAANHIPYSREDAVIDFVILDTGAEGYSKVLVVVVLREVVLRVQKILETAKISVSRATMSSLGIFYWFKKFALKDQDVSMLLDIGEDESEICICDQHHLFTARHVPLGIQMIESQPSEFLKQMDLTVGSYNKEKLGSAVTRFNVFSAREELKHFCEHLSKEYHLPVDYQRTVANASIAVIDSFKWPDDLLSGGPSVTALVGLSLGDLLEDIDLIPHEIKSAQHQKKTRSSFMRTGIAGVAAVVALIFAFNLGTMHKSLYLKDLEKQLKEVKAKVSQAQKKTEQVDALKSALYSRFIFIDTMDEIYRLLPPGTSLINLTVSGGRTLSLQGVSFKGEDINLFQNAMVGSPKFNNVNLDYVNKRTTQDGEVNYFKITCQVKASGS